MNRSRTAWVVTALFVTTGVVHGHGDGDIRYLSPTGTDAGGCADAHTACRTFAYAAGQAGKGGEVWVAEGSYHIDTVQDLFYLADDATRLEGGYSPDYHHRSATAYPTLVIGAPADMRASLEARGFQVIVDQKWDGTGQGADPALLQQVMSVVRTSTGPAQCSGGTAGGFTCAGINLRAQLALSDLSSRPSGANDIWGHVDLNTEREYALIGLRNGVAVVDVTDPDAPVEVGTIPGTETGWRDIKVLQTWDAGAERWRAWAYVTADAVSDRLTVIDLSGLPNSVALRARVTSDLRAHNLSIAGVDFSLNIPLPGRSPVAFVAGSNVNQGGFRAYSLANPVAPVLRSEGAFGYMHDGTSAMLHDPAQTLACGSPAGGCEVFADFNETSIDLWDITDTANPSRLSTVGYPDMGYAHSGSWSEDGHYLFAHDEFDEVDHGLVTQVRVFDVGDLAALQRVATWDGPTAAIDHNGYARGNRYYISNYTRGLTVLDITDPEAPSETGHFDTFPVSDAAAFSGAWGVYPFLPSRKLLVSDIQGGLFVLEDATRDSANGQIGFSQRSYGIARGTTAQIPVTRAGGTTGAVSVGWEIIHGTTGDTDAVAVRGRLQWPAGDAADRNIEVPVQHGDGAFGRMFLRLFDPRDGATLGDIGIASMFIDSGAATALRAPEEVEVDAASGRALVWVRRLGSARGEASVAFRTEDGSATAGTDYVTVNGTLVWPDGDATGRVVEVDLVGAGSSDGRDFTLLLEHPVGATLETASTSIVVSGAPPPPPPPPPPPAPPAPAPDPPERSGGGQTGWVFILALASLLLLRRRERR
jgi:choice-of-anchor B domain-containing protein